MVRTVAKGNAVETGSSGRYFEDLTVGETLTTAGRTLFEADIMNFIGLAGIYEELYTNVDYIEQESLFKRRFAPGALTFALAEGLAIQTGWFHHTGLALLEVRMKFLAPFFIGDTIRVTMKVTAKRETSKPDRGVVTFSHDVWKAGGEHVMELTKVRMVRRRAAAAVQPPVAGTGK